MSGLILIGFSSFESHDEQLPWSDLAFGVQNIVPRILQLGFSRFFVYAVLHMVPPLLHGSIVADAPRRPIVIGVIMDGRHGRVLGGCCRCTRNSLNFPPSHVGIVQSIAHK